MLCHFLKNIDSVQVSTLLPLRKRLTTFTEVVDTFPEKIDSFPEKVDDFSFHLPPPYQLRVNSHSVSVNFNLKPIHRGQGLKICLLLQSQLLQLFFEAF